MSNRIRVYEIPGKLKVEWDPKARAIVDTWTSYNISLADFRNAVLVKGLNHSKAHRGRAWIVDSSKASGSFSQEIQAYIGSHIFPAFTKNGVKYFMTITAESALTRMTVAQYSKKAGPNGLALLNGSSVDGAISWLKKHG